MSCFICSKETKERVTAIVYNESFRESASSRLFFGQEEFEKIIQGWENERGDGRIVNGDNAEQIIFNMLSDMNAIAYFSRYARPCGRVWDVESPRGIYDPKTIFSMETYKRLCCFNYQVNEEERTWKPFDGIYNMLKKIETALAQKLLFNLPEFEKINGWN